MTPTLEAMAREAGFRVFAAGNIVAADGGSSGAASASLARFAALVRAQALEDAAKVADKIAGFHAYAVLYQSTPYGMAMRDQHEAQLANVPGAKACAAAIRSLPPLGVANV